MRGARQPPASPLLKPLGRLIARAMAAEPRAFVLPGPEIALAHGLDLAGAGLRLVASPRDANVLLQVGPLPDKLHDPACVLYAQMPRPRAVLVLGAPAPGPLPAADISAELSQAGLTDAVARLRAGIAQGAFGAGAPDFEAPALQSRIRYTCPMHTEVIRDEPGKCPICGMDLMPVATAGAGHDHGGHAQGGHAHGGHDSAEAGREGHAHGATAQEALDGLEPGFMSMVEMTRGTPRSTDGLQMEWITVPFGPSFPASPAGWGCNWACRASAARRPGWR